MKNFNEFVKEIQNNIKDYLPKDYQDAEISIEDFQKLNKTCTGIQTVRPGEDMGIVINLDYFCGMYLYSVCDLKEILQEIADLVINSPTPENLEWVTNYDKIKERLFIRVSSAETNKEIFKTAPHQLIEDLVITVHVAVLIDEDQCQSILVEDKLLEAYGISKEQLFADAMSNSPKLLPSDVKTINAAIEDTWPEKIITDDIIGNPPMYVVSNTQGINGASVIFYPHFMEKMGSLLKSDFFLLPSSIHEMILVPDDGIVNADILYTLVQEVSTNRVEMADRLTNNVYHYDRKENIFETADKFIKLQQKK